MVIDWEERFSRWAKPPGKTEQDKCENAEAAIKNAIKKSQKLNARDVRIFCHGSYQNNTNVRGDSDVDLAIVCYDSFFHDYPEGTTAETFGNEPATYHYDAFKNEVEEALVSYFGQRSVKRGNKAFDIKENSYHVDADAAAFFEHRRYYKNGTYESGGELRTDSGTPFRVINWPKQHYDNGVTKNTATGKRYKSVVRIVKFLCNEMAEESIPQAKNIMGFLIECLVWNVPNKYFGHYTLTADVRESLAHLFNNTIKDETCSEWGEVCELKYLFRGSQEWTREQAFNFIDAAWNYLGLT
jgi:hypothetical protein